MRLLILIGCAVVFVTGEASRAAVVSYTSSSAYHAAISGRTTLTVNFDSSAAGTVISSGSTFGSITFNYSWASGESLRINDIANTNSGANYLGATNGTGTPTDLLADGNNFSVMPTVASSALGMFVITRDPALDGDLSLSTPGGSVSLQTAALEGVLSDNSEVYFLGLVEDAGAALGPFTLNASIDAGIAQLGYRVDDISFAAVPEPSCLLCCFVLATAYLLQRRKPDMVSRRHAIPQ